MNDEYTCKAVVLHCIDFRFRKSLYEYLAKHFPDGYDLISVAGGVKRLLADEPENNFLLEQLNISNRLHSPEKIVLIQHEDCGAYGGTKTFKNPIEEESFQEKELEKSEVLLSKSFSQKIEKYFVRLSGEFISFR